MNCLENLNVNGLNEPCNAVPQKSLTSDNVIAITETHYQL